MSTQAIAKVNPMQFDLFFTDTTGALTGVFSIKDKKEDVKDKTGAVIGERIASQTVSLIKAKDINTTFGLTASDTEKRDALVLNAKDELKKKIALMMTMISTDDNWTGSSARITKGKKGAVKMSFTVEQVERKVSEIEKLAKAYGKSPEEIVAMIKAQLEATKEPEATNVTATATPEAAAAQ